MCNSVNGATATATTAAALGSATAGKDATSVAGASGGGGASATTFDSAGVQQLMTSLDQVLRQLQATVAGMATASAGGGGDVAAATGGGSVTQGAMSCSMTAPSKLPELPAQLPPTKTAPPETPPTKAGGPEQAAPPTHKPAPAQTYVVVRGDTLTKIARRFNVDTAALYDANKDVIGANPNRINPGMKLTIPAGAPPFAERAPAPKGKGKGTGRAGASGGGSAGGAPASTVPAPGKDGKVVQSEVAYGAGRTRINYTDGTALVHGKVGPRGEDGFYTIDAQGHKGVTGI